MLVAIGLIILGLVLLTLGGELLVRGAARLATLAGISPLVVGLTVVAFGTSAPELAVSIQASFTGKADLAVGNVVGSNIFNVLLILGASALISPLIVSSQLVRFDVPLMIGISVLMLILGLDGSISRIDGLILFAGLIAYTGWLIRESRRESAKVKAEYAEEYGEPPASTVTAGQIVIQVVFIAIGLGLLSLGAHWLVDGAVTIARIAGMSELLIGLTIVAAGTSLPEVAASIMATIRGQRDIAVGNVVGSNIFNIMSVLGLSAVVSPNGVSVSQEAIQFDIPVMIAVAFACLPIFFTGHRIDRWEGALFLGYYVAYTSYLVLMATRPETAATLGNVMLLYVIPLTAITLAVGVVHSFRKSRRQARAVSQG